MREAIRLGTKGMQNNEGGPFGSVIVLEDRIIGRGYNRVLSTNDPTAHAEIVAIRDACRQLGHFQLDDCVIYSSCEPCPMCLGAIYWARPKRLYYGCSRQDAAKIEFDDAHIYEEIALLPHLRRIPATQLLRNESLELFRKWLEKSDRVEY